MTNDTEVEWHIERAERYTELAKEYTEQAEWHTKRAEQCTELAKEYTERAELLRKEDT